MPGELGAVEREARAFVAHLRAGRREEARALWSSRLRESAVPDEVAERLAPTIRDSDWVRFTSGKTTDTKACVSGGVGTDGVIVDSVSHSFRLYCVRENGRWRIDAAQIYANGAAAPTPPWPSSWHGGNDRTHPGACASGY